MTERPGLMAVDIEVREPVLIPCLRNAARRRRARNAAATMNNAPATMEIANARAAPIRPMSGVLAG